MRKIITSLLIIIFCFSIVMPSVYAVDEKRIKGYLYKNTDHIYLSENNHSRYIRNRNEDEPMDNPDDEKELMQSQGYIKRQSWLYAAYDLAKYAGSYESSYITLSKIETSEDLKLARNALWNAADWLSDDEAFGKVIANVTKNEYLNRESLYFYFSEQAKIFEKAYYSATGNVVVYGVSLGHDYKTKFQYNLDDIIEYKKQYNGSMNYGDWTEEQRQTIEKLWRIKTGNPNSSIATRKNLYIAKEDSYETMMSYDKDQIVLYNNLFGNIPRLQYNDQIKAVMIEWASIIKYNQHTEFYNNHLVNDGAGIRIFRYNANDGYYGRNPSGEKDKDTLNNYSDILNSIEKLKLISDEDYNKLNQLQLYNVNDIILKDIQEHDEKDAATGKGATIYTGKYVLPERNPDNTTTTNIDNVVSTADSFMNKAGTDSKINTIGQDEYKNLSDTIYNILFIAGIIIAVIIGAIIGIKYIVGSIEEKANLKEILVPYLVGCAVVFGAFGIWKLAVTIFTDM